MRARALRRSLAAAVAAHVRGDHPQQSALDLIFRFLVWSKAFAEAGSTGYAPQASDDVVRFTQNALNVLREYEDGAGNVIETRDACEAAIQKVQSWCAEAVYSSRFRDTADELNRLLPQVMDALAALT